MQALAHASSHLEAALRQGAVAHPWTRSGWRPTCTFLQAHARAGAQALPRAGSRAAAAGRVAALNAAVRQQLAQGLSAALPRSAAMAAARQQLTVR